MIDLEEKKKIGELYLCQRRSVNAISKTLKHHRNTVSKVIWELDRCMKEEGISRTACVDWNAFMERHMIGPSYSSGNRKPTKLTPELKEEVIKIWEESKGGSRMKIYEEKIKISKKEPESVSPKDDRGPISYETFCKAIRGSSRKPSINTSAGDEDNGEPLDY